MVLCENDFLVTLLQAAALRCKHYSLYFLSIKPKTKLYRLVTQREWTMCDDQTALAMMEVNDEEMEVRINQIIFDPYGSHISQPSVLGWRGTNSPITQVRVSVGT